MSLTIPIGNYFFRFVSWEGMGSPDVNINKGVAETVPFLDICHVSDMAYTAVLKWEDWAENISGCQSSPRSMTAHSRSVHETIPTVLTLARLSNCIKQL